MFTFIYRISSYSFRGNYSFLKLEIQRSQYITPKVTIYKGAETIQERKLFKGGNYIRKYDTNLNLNLSRRTQKFNLLEFKLLTFSAEMKQ